MDYREELIKQVNQLLSVLKHMLKANGSYGPLIWKDEVGGSLTLNIYFCDSVPVDEELDFMDDNTDENADDHEWELSTDGIEALKYEITDRDQEFLKANGLMF